MSFSVQGRSAIVTGAGSGINLAFAKLLLENGCNVLIADLALRPEAQVVVNKYSTASSRPRAVFQKTDVIDWKQLEQMFEVAEREFGEIDIVCPGAGIYEPHWSNFWRPPGTPESRDAQYGGRYALLDINLTHPIRTTQLALSHFRNRGTPQRRKHIIHISSIAGQNAALAAPIYVATKHAINGLVRSMAKLDDKFGIRVTAVAPGVIKTPLWTDHPEKIKIVDDKADEWVTPEEVAEVMLALIQQDSVGEIIGDKSGKGPQYRVSGGTVLEVSKTVRSVSPFNDPGPSNRAGNTVSDMNVLEDEVSLYGSSYTMSEPLSMSDPLRNPAEYGPEIRYSSCLVLENIGIPYVIWFEDALAHYGVPTIVFDLYLLILDIDTAADALIKAGWVVDTQNPHRIGDSVVTIPQTPLISPDQKTKTVLLLASDWRFPLAADPPLERVPVNDHSPSKLSFPLLPGLLDALIESWLVGPTEDATLLVRLAVYFNYLYGYVPALKERSFADQMKYEHRQFHFDVLAGMDSSTFPFRNHQRGIRDALLQGQYELQECSAPRDNEALFDPWKGIRLPDPVNDGSVE
ncbi:NAD-dependent 15-hydroxyprostaglandin dehydrogenase [Aspergillus terreus]|uniref:NAD-dependent 15-hydroxyprostaglandin dehydrogenase n=1 Tax=Aspergillus terreus TaxID=33178 RepID=A0A5M3ZAN9_ASPTE|nr:hypothetical protein ATETN484_0010029000 [Aspergillus terreus]GFF18337.1 NAD-dependent 15-hydroxyprostaglandin dehydrogenase [Aspergillus terreus]